MSPKLLIVSMLLGSACAGASADNAFPLPFSGSYQSLASEALELTSRQDDNWIAIPQNVYLDLVKDQDILELQLTIEVLDSAGQKLYPIKNSMWLRHIGNDQLEVYKINRDSGVFDKVGDGACGDNSCSYEYVIMAHNNGNPYQQKYMSTISWNPEENGAGFAQAGSLSARLTDVEQGQDPWLLFKTWTNQFEVMP